MTGAVGLTGLAGDPPNPEPLLDPNPDPLPEPKGDEVPVPETLLPPNPFPVPPFTPVPPFAPVPLLLPFMLPAVVVTVFWVGSKTNSHWL